MPDRQLVAFSGQPDGSILFVDRRVTPEIQVLIRHPGDFTPITHNVGDIDADPAQWEDALKVSGCINLTVNAGVVRGGNEDVLDANRSRNVFVNIEDAYPRGRFCSTQKGASDGIHLTIKRQHGHGKEVDHDYGNNAPGTNGYTKNCSLSVGWVNTGKVVVRLLRCNSVALAGGAAFRYAFPWPSPKWLHNVVIWILNRIQ